MLWLKELAEFFPLASFSENVARATLDNASCPCNNDSASWVFLLCHPWLTATNLSYRFPILETSGTASCGTTGMEFCTAPHLLHFPVIVLFISTCEPSKELRPFSPSVFVLPSSCWTSFSSGAVGCLFLSLGVKFKRNMLLSRLSRVLPG